MGERMTIWHQILGAWSAVPLAWALDLSVATSIAFACGVSIYYAVLRALKARA